MTLLYFAHQHLQPASATWTVGDLSVDIGQVRLFLARLEGAHNHHPLGSCIRPSVECAGHIHDSGAAPRRQPE
jgi:hypothetical protein